MPDIFITPDEQIHLNKDMLPKKTNASKELQKARLNKKRHSPLSAFFLYPDNAHFETKEEDEDVVLLLRQHPIINVKWILLAIIMFFVPKIVGDIGIFESLPLGFAFVFSLCWYLVIVAYSLENFLSWYFNVYIVTDRRVIDVDFYNLIYKQVSDAQLTKIEDVTYNMGGVVRTFFNYGNIFIQTAGEINQFEFLAVPHPDKVAKIIQDLMTP